MKAGVCVFQRLFVSSVCVRLHREAAGKRVEKHFPAAGKKGKSHRAEELKSSRNFNNAFPAWASAAADPWSRYISRERMLKNIVKRLSRDHNLLLHLRILSEVRQRSKREKKWAREKESPKDSKGECGMLSNLINVLKPPGQRVRNASLVMVVIMFSMDIIQNHMHPTEPLLQVRSINWPCTDK